MGWNQSEHKAGEAPRLHQERCRRVPRDPVCRGPGRRDPVRAPAPPRRWEGTRDALAYGATALQPDQEFTLIPEPTVEGDNCLNLNVFSPDLGTSGLPVLVWIHGGGFFAGCSASPWYRGERFARDGVVLVSINYRLGIRGVSSDRGRRRQPRRPRLAGRLGVGTKQHRGVRGRSFAGDRRGTVSRRRSRRAPPVDASSAWTPTPCHLHERAGDPVGDSRTSGRDRSRRGPRSWNAAHRERTQ